MKKSKATLLATSIVTSAFILTGCGISGPTYGTDKTSSQQLFDDIGSMVSLKTINKNSQVDVRPRPELVHINPDKEISLPVPQQNVATVGTKDWPESPEQLRQRLRDEATANQGNRNYVSPIISGSVNDTTPKSQTPLKDRDTSWLDGIHRNDQPQNTKQQRAEYQRLKQQNEGGTATTRKYLSEPPLSYRQPATTAAAGEIGEDEAKKERERKKAADAESGKKSWWPF